MCVGGGGGGGGGRVQGVAIDNKALVLVLSVV